MRIGILCNGIDVTLWQFRAIERIADGNEIFLLVGGQIPAPSRSARHALYYALNLVAIRNRLTRMVSFPVDTISIVDRIDFEPSYDGAWAVLPQEVLDWVQERQLDVIVKFGLNLLRVPDKDRLPAPILSFHHGDPRKYRGRPAGFYELLAGERFVGQIVQIIGNKLDAGTVLAFAESRIIHHSYRKTLIEAYSLSPFLLPQALDALRAKRVLAIKPTGRNYRLPGNARVFRFILHLAGRLSARLFYGAFIEKRWRVALAPVTTEHPTIAVPQVEGDRSTWRGPALLRPYSFYADAFFHGGIDDIIVEGMNSRSGKGELVRIRGGDQQRIEGFSGHVSYPAPVEADGHIYTIPETAGWSAPAVFEISNGKAARVADLDIDDKNILDPTFLRYQDRLYLFGNRREDGTSVLHLWSAPSLFGRFQRHPASPVRLSARGSRMAGQLIRHGDELIRPGQDFRDGYGDGILAFRVEELSPETYRESEVGEAAFQQVKGPHTVNFCEGQMLFDWYTERFSPFAGLRRALNKI